MKKLLCVILLIPFGFLISCNAQEQSNSIGKTGGTGPQKINARQAKALIDEGGPCIILDVRTEGEFNERRIDGSILIPDYEIAARAETELTDKNAVILVYCRSGVRSARAAQILAGMGYTSIYDLGGIINWPYDTVGN